ncbi:MAG: poly-beta-hydroxybutyrate polymerase N-terminal domain-containing protein, partial [Pseudomonadota bacterium]
MTGHTHTGRQKNASPATGSGRTAHIKAGTADLPLSGLSSGEGLSRAVADSALNASIARMTGGISPVSIIEAYLDWLFHLALAPGHHAQILREGADNCWRLFDYASQCAATGGKARSCVEPAPNDRRFKDPSWQTFPFNFVHQAFLLQQDWWHQATIGVPGVTHQNERMVEFYSRQWLDTVCPANFLATNPEIIQRTLSTGGGNLLSGGMHFFDDMRRAFSDAPPTGAEAFVPGKDVATRKGKVVFKNALMELIQYEPTTKKVHAEPILITPAWIM